MRKKTIAYLYVPGIILAIIGYVFTFMDSAAAVSAIQAATTPAAAQAAAASAISVPGLILSSVGGILVFISWIGALVATGKQGRWGWFCVVLLLSWFFTIAELVYLIAGPGLGSAPAATAQG